MNTKIILFSLLLITFLFSCSEDSTTPTVEPEYVTVGTQVWKTKNLDVAYYRNGDIIPQVTDAKEWENLTTGAWCYYNNDPTMNEKYGKLYNWYAINDARGLAPQGWRIPSIEDWDTLIVNLGGYNTAGGAMKSTGTSYWIEPNEGATNSSGLSIRPAGFRYYTNGMYNAINYGAYFGSSSDVNTNKAYAVVLHYNDAMVVKDNDSHKRNGYSIRCIKD